MITTRLPAAPREKEFFPGGAERRLFPAARALFFLAAWAAVFLAARGAGPRRGEK